MNYLTSILLIYSGLIYSQSYQVGEFWSKKHINNSTSKVKYLKESIGEVSSSATLFFIGKKNEKYWAITNYHVCPQTEDKRKKTSSNKCKDRSVHFHYYRNKRGKELFGTVKNVPLIDKTLDLALLEISFTNLDSFNRQPKALVLSDQQPYKSQELISLGYGVNQNEYGSLMIEYDSFECKVFSNDIKLISDPDEYNPVNYKVHSFLHGCDVSHGDSGSPIIDRNTHEVVGLLWSGKFPKSQKVSKRGFEKLPLKFLWKELNFASPASKIKERLELFFNN